MRQPLTSLLAALAFGAAACATPASGSDTGSDTASQVAEEPVVVVDARGEEVVIESTDRIIPLDGDLAEIVFALGLGEQVVATDLSATYPPAADAKPEIGYQRALSAEPIVVLEPTVLLATDIAGPRETLAELERVGIPLVMIATPIGADGPGAKIRAVAAALGVDERGDELADSVDAAIAAVVRTVDPPAGPPMVAPLYLRGQSTQLVLGTEMATGWTLDALGADNVAAELGVRETAPINIEALTRLEPDVIITTASGLASVGGIDGLLELPGFAEMPAGRDRRVLAFDDQFLLGNGPRTAELVAELAARLYDTATDVHADVSTDTDTDTDDGTTP